MTVRKWFSADEEQAAMETARRNERFVWRYTKQNQLRGIARVDVGFYVGRALPNDLRKAGSRARLVYDPSICWTPKAPAWIR